MTRSRRPQSLTGDIESIEAAFLMPLTALEALADSGANVTTIASGMCSRGGELVTDAEAAFIRTRRRGGAEEGVAGLSAEEHSRVENAVESGMPLTRRLFKGGK